MNIEQNGAFAKLSGEYKSTEIPESRITQEAKNLEHSISYLGELVEALEPRIVKVLSSSFPASESGSFDSKTVNTAPDYSVVANTFIELRTRVDSISEKLSNILNRVEL